MTALMAIALAGATPTPTPVTVEIVAAGHVQTPADRFRLTGNVLACAATQAEADALLAQKTATIDRAMTDLGVTRAHADEKLSLADMMSDMSGRGSNQCNVNTLLKQAAAANAKEQPVEKVGSSAFLAFDAPSRATALRAIAALKSADAKPSDKASPVLLDDTAARHAAKQQALAKARTEASAYAASLGLGGATLTKISERQDIGSTDFVGQMIRAFGAAGLATGDTVSTDVTLTVEFRLDGR